jgi:hypothetical protein
MHRCNQVPVDGRVSKDLSVGGRKLLEQLQFEQHPPGQDAHWPPQHLKQRVKAQAPPPPRWTSHELAVRGPDRVPDSAHALFQSHQVFLPSRGASRTCHYTKREEKGKDRRSVAGMIVVSAAGT